MHERQLDQAPFKTCSLVTSKGKTSAYLVSVVCTSDYCIMFITVGLEDWVELSHYYQQNPVDQSF